MKPKRMLSLVISENVIEFLEIKNKMNNLNLLSYGSYDCDLNDLEQFEEVISIIAQTIKKPLYTGISFIHREVLRMTILLDRTNDLKTIILQNIKKQYDISLSEYHIDYITEELDNNKILVFIAALPKKILDPLFTILKKYNFKLLFLEPGISSTLRTLHKQSGLELFLHLHLDMHFSSIAISKNEMIYATRILNLGFEDMINWLSEAGGIDKNKAKSLFFEYGTKEIDTDDEIIASIHKSIIDSFDKLSLEIQRTIDFYSITYKKENIKNFIISGIVEKIPDFDKYLSKLFSAKTENENSAKLLTIPPNITPDFSSMKFLYVAIGVALR